MEFPGEPEALPLLVSLGPAWSPPRSHSMPVVQAVPLTRLTYKQSNLSRATYRHFKMSHVRLKAKSEARQPLQVSSIRHFRDCGPFSGPQVDCWGGEGAGVAYQYSLNMPFKSLM